MIANIIEGTSLIRKIILKNYFEKLFYQKYRDSEIRVKKSHPL